MSKNGEALQAVYACYGHAPTLNGKMDLDKLLLVHADSCAVPCTCTPYGPRSDLGEGFEWTS